LSTSHFFDKNDARFQTSLLSTTSWKSWQSLVRILVRVAHWMEWSYAFVSSKCFWSMAVPL